MNPQCYSFVFFKAISEFASYDFPSRYTNTHRHFKVKIIFDF